MGKRTARKATSDAAAFARTIARQRGRNAQWAEEAVRNGSAEIDMVINIGALRDKKLDRVRDDIRAVVDAAHQGGAWVKVIFENCYLQDEHKIRLCEICGEAGYHARECSALDLPKNDEAAYR